MAFLVVGGGGGGGGRKQRTPAHSIWGLGDQIAWPWQGASGGAALVLGPRPEHLSRAPKSPRLPLENTTQLFT